MRNQQGTEETKPFKKPGKSICDLFCKGEDKDDSGGLFGGNMPLVVGGLAAAGLGAFVLMENIAPILSKAETVNVDANSRSFKKHPSPESAEASQCGLCLNLLDRYIGKITQPL